MKPIKLAKHIKKVGVKQFKQEFNEEKSNLVEADPLKNLKLQIIGQIGVIVFSLISMALFIWVGMWYIGGIFLFNCIIQFAGFRNTKSQYKLLKDIQAQEQELISSSL